MVRRAVRRLGYDITRYSPQASYRAQRLALLRHHAVDVVLDVGANIGQFAGELRRDGYDGRIVSFEPLHSAFAVLDGRAADDARWEAVNIGLGATAGPATINVAGNSQSSSLLPMGHAHREAAPTSTYVGTEQIEVRRLDDVFEASAAGASTPFLKLDVQGYERQVLEGAKSSLPAIVGLQLEVSVVELYEGETLLPEMLALLAGDGFVLAAMTPSLIEPSSARLLQLDAVFLRDRV
jgi:FkbM family methyltransferase